MKRSKTNPRKTLSEIPDIEKNGNFRSTETFLKFEARSLLTIDASENRLSRKSAAMIFQFEAQILTT